MDSASYCTKDNRLRTWDNASVAQLIEVRRRTVPVCCH
jgi:hypothetical protein